MCGGLQLIKILKVALMNASIANCLKNLPEFQIIHGKPKNPWEKLHIDFAGPLKGHVWLILMDALTKWSKVKCKVLRSLFASGMDFHISWYPTMVHSSLLTHSASFAKGIHHKLSVPYHPSTNSEIERLLKLSNQV